MVTVMDSPAILSVRVIGEISIFSESCMVMALKIKSDQVHDKILRKSNRNGISEMRSPNGMVNLLDVDADIVLFQLG